MFKRSRLTVVGNYGTITGTYDARQLQLGVKVTF